MKHNLTIRDQYKLACRFARMRMFDEISTHYAEMYAKSFGISATVLHAAFRAQVIRDFHGWRDWNRSFQFQERKAALVGKILA